MSDLSGTKHRAGEAIADAADTVGRAANQAGGHANDLLNETEDLIRQNPWLSVLAAAALGYMWARVRH